MTIIERIEKLVEKIIENYPDLIIGYHYNKDSDCFEIWHNRKDLEYNNIEFRNLTGKLLTELFLDNDIYNVYISYNHEKSLNSFNAEFITKFKKIEFSNYPNKDILNNFTIEDQNYLREYSDLSNKTTLKRSNCITYCVSSAVTQNSNILEAA